MNNKIKMAIDRGESYPYDAPDAWWCGDGDPPPATDWAHAAARGVVSDLRNRREMMAGAVTFVDENVRTEIVADMRAIIQTAHDTDEKQIVIHQREEMSEHVRTTLQRIVPGLTSGSWEDIYERVRDICRDLPGPRMRQ